jgi:hypothetical protein
LTHLQFEALLIAATQSPNRCDLVLWSRVATCIYRIPGDTEALPRIAAR